MSEEKPKYETLGQALAAHRQRAGCSIETLAETTHIQKKYLLAIEADQLEDLPDPIYVRHFLRAIEKALKAQSTSLLSYYDPGEEDGAGVLPPTPPSRMAFLVPTKLFARIGIVALVLAISIVLFFQARAIYTPPELQVTNPKDSDVLTESVVQVTGHTDRGSELIINGETAYPDTNGDFSVSVDLHQGVNLIKIAAKKLHSSEQILYRQVVVAAPASSTTSTPLTNIQPSVVPLEAPVR